MIHNQEQIQMMHNQEVSQWSPLVIRIIGLNPGPFTLSGSNTYLIGNNRNRILIDSGQGEDKYFDNLKKVLEDTNSIIHTLLISHHHRDHVGGIQQIIDLNKNVTIKKFQNPIQNKDKEIEEEFNIKFQFFNDQEIIQGDGFSLQAFRLSGHCEDHVCFILNEEKTIFMGDFILTGSSSIVSDMKFQFESFYKVLNFDINNIFPGHGYPIFGKEQAINEIKKNLNHRLMREQKILKVFQENQSKYVDIEKILKQVYPEVSDQFLIQGAKNNIKVHLQKLIQDKLIIYQGDSGYQIIEQIKEKL